MWIGASTRTDPLAVTDWFYFPSNGVEPSVLADLLSSGRYPRMLWATSPACTGHACSTGRSMHWVCPSTSGSMLPGRWRCAQDTASSVVLACLVAAERIEGQTNIDGVSQHERPLIAYVSTQSIQAWRRRPASVASARPTCV